jgi:S1-C subfamily serine protease
VVPVLLAGCGGMFRPDLARPRYVSGEPAATSVERRAEQATVRIRNLGCEALSTGSGVVIGERELLTNAHVIAGAETLEINLWDGTTLSAAVRSAVSADDLAIVEVDSPLTGDGRAAVAEFASADPPVGTPLLVFGFPGGLRFTVDKGEVESYAEVDGERSIIMTNPVVPGNSGGPVFDDTGAVVGIVRARLVDTGNGVAIPVSTVDAALAVMRDAPGGGAVGCDVFVQ